MISPVAARLRTLLAEDPRRSASSLLITGHSAGGAVAALLYSHMLAASPETESELNILSGYFKRIHCITFGAPPVSLLPLAKPERRELRKSLFIGFINEGDPVARADKAYVKSLLELYAAPAPNNSNTDTAANSTHKLRPLLTGNKAASSSTLTVNKIRPSGPTHTKSAPAIQTPAPIWVVPPSTLSNAGRLILLRSVPVNNNGKKRGILEADNRMDDGVQARIVTDEQLRGVIWGDPVCHMMKLYSRRIEVLATNAVVGRG
jgi:Lipase (class 3)